MNYKYQILFLGHENPFIQQIKEALLVHLTELGIDTDISVVMIDETNFEDEFKENAPAFCLYFSKFGEPSKNSNFLQRLLADATLIIPVVEELSFFTQIVPQELQGINGYCLSSEQHIEALSNYVLEGLGLLRLSRRIFISYKRDESSSVAIQLFESLEKHGFDVFLDTHSIRTGDSFQDELWHRMADTDVVVVLNTPEFMTSKWTAQELAKANAMSIGVLQVIWPGHSLEDHAKLSIPLSLTDSDFGNNNFSDSKSFLASDTVSKIVNQVESLRARSLASRQDNIVTEFVRSVKSLGITVTLQPEKFLTIKKIDGDYLVFIPAIGVPQAFTYNQSEEIVARIRETKPKAIYLLYDHRSIRDKWIEHLSWLNNYLPIKSIKIVEAQTWLQNNL